MNSKQFTQQMETTSRQQPHFLTISYKSKSVTPLNQIWVLQKVLWKYRTNTVFLSSNFIIQEYENRQITERQAGDNTHWKGRYHQKIYILLKEVS